MRYLTCFLVALCVSCANVCGTEPADGQQASASESQVSKRGTHNPEAYELYSRGRSCWNKRTRLSDIKKAISDFNQATAKDPVYALAYAGLAEAYAVLPDYDVNASQDIAESNVAARKALELDPTLAGPHAAMGYTKFGHAWDFAGAEAEFKKAIELDPNDATAHQWYAEELGPIGREQEALAEIERAHQLDPQSAVITHAFGMTYIYARRYDEAIVVCRKLADENPTYAAAHECLANGYWGKKMYPEAVGERKAHAKFSGDRSDSDYAAALEQGFRSGGWDSARKKAIEFLRAQNKPDDSSAYGIAELYADLGEKEQAFRWLNTALQERDQGLLDLKTDFTLDSLRSDPRFAELVRKVGLPQ